MLPKVFLIHTLQDCSPEDTWSFYNFFASCKFPAVFFFVLGVSLFNWL
jgi:hypothetical protein